MKKLRVLSVLVLVFAVLFTGCGDTEKSEKIDLKLEITLPLGASSAAVEVDGDLQLGIRYIPENTTFKGVTWTSSNVSAATVGVTSGNVSGLSLGTTVITATSNHDKKITAKLEVQVVPSVPITAVAIVKPGGESSIEIKEGETYQLNLAFTPVNTTQTSVSWAPANASVVTVSNTGLVTAVGGGRTNVTVRSNSNQLLTDTIEFVVIEDVISISLERDEYTILKDGRTRANIVLNPSQATARNFEWSVGNPDLIEVNYINGNLYAMISGKAIGNTTVTVSILTEDKGLLTATSNIKIIAQPVFPTSHKLIARTYTDGSTNTTGSTAEGTWLEWNGEFIGELRGSKWTGSKVAQNVGGNMGDGNTRRPNHSTFFYVEDPRMGPFTWYARFSKGAGTGFFFGVFEDPKMVYDDFINLIGFRYATSAGNMRLFSANSTSSQLSSTPITDLATLPVNEIHTFAVAWTGENYKLKVISSSGVVINLNSPSGLAPVMLDPSGSYYPGFFVSGDTVIIEEIGYLEGDVINSITPPASVAVEGITLDKTTIELSRYSSAQITASLIPGNASNKNITWISGDPDKVSVNGTSLVATVTGRDVTAAPVTITAKTEEGSFTAVCSVTVTPFDGVTLFNWDADNDPGLADLGVREARTINDVSVKYFFSSSGSTLDPNAAPMKIVRSGDLLKGAQPDDPGITMTRSGYLLVENQAPCLQIGATTDSRTGSSSNVDGELDLSKPFRITVEYTGISRGTGAGTLFVAIYNNTGGAGNSPLGSTSAESTPIAIDGVTRTYTRTFDPSSLSDVNKERLAKGFIIVRTAVAQSQLVVHSIRIEPAF